MDRKSVLIVIAGFVAVCLCIVVVGIAAMGGTSWLLFSSVGGDQAEVAASSEAIASYTLPAGFGDGYTVNIAGFSLVGYTGADGRSHIYLVQAPSGVVVDEEALQQRMGEATGSNDWTEVTVVERQPCTIRGQESTLVISEGVNHDGERYRSASSLFEGKGGLALVNISAPSDHWDQEMVDTFIESLR